MGQGGPPSPPAQGSLPLEAAELPPFGAPTVPPTPAGGRALRAAPRVRAGRLVGPASGTEGAAAG